MERFFWGGGAEGGGVRAGGGAHFRAEGAVVMGPPPHPQLPGLALLIPGKEGRQSQFPSPQPCPEQARSSAESH